MFLFLFIIDVAKLLRRGEEVELEFLSNGDIALFVVLLGTWGPFLRRGQSTKLIVK